MKLRMRSIIPENFKKIQNLMYRPWAEITPRAPPPPHASVNKPFLGSLIYPIEEKICQQEKFSDELLTFFDFLYPIRTISAEFRF